MMATPGAPERRCELMGAGACAGEAQGLVTPDFGWTEGFRGAVGTLHWQVEGVELSFGIVSVTEEVIAFQKKRIADNEVLDLLPVELPEQQFITQALWYELPEPLLREEFPLDVLQGSIHAAELGAITYGLLLLLPLMLVGALVGMVLDARASRRRRD